MRPSSGCEIYYILILNHQYWVFESRFIRNVVMKPNNFIEYLFAFIDLTESQLTFLTNSKTSAEFP